MNILHFMLDALTSAYSREPDSNIGRLLSLYAEGMTDAEAALNKVDAWRDIEAAAGTTLDRIGMNYGVAREGMDDTYYRLMIQTKIISLLSGGDVDTLIQAVAALLETDMTDVELRELFPAKVRVALKRRKLTRAQLDNIEMLVRMTKRIALAGVEVKFILKDKTDLLPDTLYIGFGKIINSKVTFHMLRFTLEQIDTLRHVASGLWIGGNTTIKMRGA